MSDGDDDVKGTDTPARRAYPVSRPTPSSPQMSREELLELGGKIDGVEIVYKEPRWPVPGTKAEKRAERTGRVLASAGRLFGAGAAGRLPVLAVGVQAATAPTGEFATRWPPRCTD